MSRIGRARSPSAPQRTPKCPRFTPSRSLSITIESAQTAGYSDWLATDEVVLDYIATNLNCGDSITAQMNPVGSGGMSGHGPGFGFERRRAAAAARGFAVAGGGVVCERIVATNRKFSN